MRSIRPVSAYTGSTDISINASISWRKIQQRCRLLRPDYKPASRYQIRLKHKRAARRMQPDVVR
ncbi:MAG: hypothetical protein M0P59_01330 [Gallionella sp.]|jgi:hypothetical protein|nr:hypothetical protein [Gallionella sp.]MCK9352784.1 hypothetical protein [Gallionella sp.]